MTNWEKYFGTPDRAAATYNEMGLCILEETRYECSGDGAASDRCPYYGRCNGLKSQIEWLESEVDA